MAAESNRCLVGSVDLATAGGDWVGSGSPGGGGSLAVRGMERSEGENEMISLDWIELGTCTAGWLFSVLVMGLILVLIVVDACRV